MNEYLEYKGNIRVFVRVRPILSQDFKAYGGNDQSFEILTKCIQVNNDQQISLEDEKKEQTFTFDNIFDRDST